MILQRLIFQQIKNELVNGSIKRGHPFKYFTLGSIKAGNPVLRTVVLRQMLQNMNIVFYTDKRSNKVNQILENNSVSALFYHPRKLLQLQLEGTARIISDPEVLSRIWNSIPASSQKDYSTSSAPGTSIKSPEEIEYLTTDNYFCMVEIVPHTIEYLRLKRPNHIRVKFVRENEDWRGQFLVP